MEAKKLIRVQEAEKTETAHPSSSESAGVQDMETAQTT